MIKDLNLKYFDFQLLFFEICRNVIVWLIFFYGVMIVNMNLKVNVFILKMDIK